MGGIQEISEGCEGGVERYPSRYLEGREDTGRAQRSINVVLKDRSA